MSLFNYVDLGAGLPPAPIVALTSYPPEWEQKSTENLGYSCTAFLDTGSDCTLIPLEAIVALNLTTFKANAQIVGVGGGTNAGFRLLSCSTFKPLYWHSRPVAVSHSVKNLDVEQLM